MTTNFRDDAGIVRLDGTLYAPGATVGDVLTVQADGSLAPAAGGGSQPGTLTEYVIPIAWDTPNLDAGIEVYTPTPGDRLLRGSGLSLTEPWDGTGTTPSLGFAGFLTELVSGSDVSDGTIDSDPGSSGNLLQFDLTAVIPGAANTVYFSTAEPIICTVDDGMGGPSGATQGALEVRLLIVSKGTTP